MDRGLLNKATSADYEPVPGFTLSSITSKSLYFFFLLFSLEITHEGPAICKQLEEYLISKLAKDHSGVKLKVLRIIRFVCENEGSHEFRRLIQRKSDLIRQCQSYRGAQDPLRGDSPNKAVRDEAAATMKALFAAENSGIASCQPAPNPIQSRIQGMGNTEFVPPAPAASYQPQPTYSSGPRQMESMGNPYFNNNGPSGSRSASLSSIMQSENPTRELISAVTTGVQSVVETIAQKANPYLPDHMRTTSTPPMFSSGYSGSSMAPPARSDWAPPRMTPPPLYVVEETRSADSLASDSSVVAKSLVNELCLLNAARVVPAQQSLDAFVAKCESVDGTRLGQALVAKLNDPSVQWVHKVKVLSGIEALHAAGLDAVSATVMENSAAVVNLMTSPQCGQKATAVAGLLGLIEGLRPEAAPPSRPSAVVNDLLDLGEAPVMPTASTGDLLDFEGPPAISPATSPELDSLI